MDRRPFRTLGSDAGGGGGLASPAVSHFGDLGEDGVGQQNSEMHEIRQGLILRSRRSRGRG